MADPLRDLRWPIDESIFHAINDLDWAWLQQVWVIASTRAFGLSVFALVLVVLLVQLRREAWRAVLALVIAIGTTDFLGAQVFKPLVGRMRPSFALEPSQVHVLLPAANVGSMPSLHSANSFTVVLVLAFVRPRLALAVLPIATLIAVSRVGVGVHWPSDIVVGAIYGSLVGALCGALTRRFTRSRGAVPEAR